MSLKETQAITEMLLALKGDLLLIIFLVKSLTKNKKKKGKGG
jgi:hypothetical protein